MQRKKKVKGLLKEVKNLVKEKKNEEARKLLPQVYKALDKTAKSKTIKKGTADRKKSRMTKLINRTEK